MFVDHAQPDTADEMFHISLKYLSHVWSVWGLKSQRELDGDLSFHSAVHCCSSRSNQRACFSPKASKMYLIDEKNIFNWLINILWHPPATLSSRLRTNLSKRLGKKRIFLKLHTSKLTIFQCHGGFFAPNWSKRYEIRLQDAGLSIFHHILFTMSSRFDSETEKR